MPGNVNDPVAADLSQPDPPTRGSLVYKSSARLAADAVGLACALAVGVLTARLLGPGGKGLFAAISLLLLVFTHIAGAGLGEAAIVRVGQGRIALQDALSATVGAVALSSVVSAGLLLAAGALSFHASWSTASAPVLVAAFSVPVLSYYNAFSQILNARERIVATSTMLIASTLATTMAVALFLGPLDLGVTGAMLAGAVGAVVGLAGCSVLLVRSGLTPSFGWDGTYARAAFQYGAKIQAAYLASSLAARFDLLLVFWISGQAQAGYYSVALTIGALVGMIPWAVSYATFPRLAIVSGHEARQLTIATCRMGVVAAAMAAVVLAIATPFVVPIAFGARFDAAIVPALVLLPCGLVASLQVLYCRALAARGDVGPLLTSSTVSLLVMCALDAAVIPAFGIVGAAVVASVSPAIGLWVVLRAKGPRGGSEISMAALTPRWADVRTMLSMLGTAVASATRAVLRPST